MSAIGSVVLDTSVVVDYLRQQDHGLIQKLEAAQELYVPLVVLGELLYGAHKSRRKEKTLTEVRAFMRVCSLLLPDEATAEFYGEIKAGLSQRATPIPQNDIWIAAVALGARFAFGDA